MVDKSLLQAVEGVDNARVQPVEPVQSGAIEGEGKKDAHGFITETFASEGRLKRMDVGQGVLFNCVEGDVKQLNVLFLMIVEDTLWLHPKWLIAAVLLMLEMANLLKKKSHGKIGVRGDIGY